MAPLTKAGKVILESHACKTSDYEESNQIFALPDCLAPSPPPPTSLSLSLKEKCCAGASCLSRCCGGASGLHRTICGSGCDKTGQRADPEVQQSAVQRGFWIRPQRRLLYCPLFWYLRLLCSGNLWIKFKCGERTDDSCDSCVVFRFGPLHIWILVISCAQ